MEEMSATFVVVGGGIAGVSCVEFLPRLVPDETVLLISASPLVKSTLKVAQITPNLEEFQVEEKPIETLTANSPNLSVIADKVVKLNSSDHTVITAKGRIIRYKKLLIATGGKPKLIFEDNEFVLGIRDTETVETFQQKLKTAKRIVVVGNGGIATELVYEIDNCQVIWAIKDSSISSTFFDPGAAEFFMPHLQKEKLKTEKVVKRLKYTLGGSSTKVDSQIHGSALGPDWSSGLKMSGDSCDSARSVHVEYSCEVQNILSPEELKIKGKDPTELNDKENTWPIYVELTNGKIYGCDFVVSAVGVNPDTEVFRNGNDFQVSEDFALTVDNQLRTSIPDVFAAGDVCHASWELAKHWFQMRLWTQARHMGCYAAKCMLGSLKNEEIVTDFSFEMFTHVTKFFGLKVVLLGLFNGQKLGQDYEMILRMTKGEEYLKLVLQDGRIQGAILIGETDLEEVFENLILNQMDVSKYGEDILDPNVDIEDYFD